MLFIVDYTCQCFILSWRTHAAGRRRFNANILGKNASLACKIGVYNIQCEISPKQILIMNAQEENVDISSVLLLPILFLNVDGHDTVAEISAVYEGVMTFISHCILKYRFS